MYGWENWTTKRAEQGRIDAFELWYWRRLLRVPWTARRSNQFIPKEISPGCITDSMDMGLGKLQSWWWTGRPGVLWFMGSQRVGHEWATELNWLTHFRASPIGSDGRVCLQCGKPGFYTWVGKMPWRGKWQPTPVFLPGESHEQGNLEELQSMGSQTVRHNWGTNTFTFFYWLIL